jgi:2-C-methyl-D-erythritol 4-phosphate cytidylyltransferase
MITAIILASGSGLRFQDNQPKQFMKLAGLPVMVHTLKIFQSSSQIDSVVIVCHEDYSDYVWELCGQYGLTKVSKVVVGGSTRQESSQIGIDTCGEDTDYVLLHDSVRPFLTHKVIDEIVAAAKKHGAADTVIPSADTLVQVDCDGFIEEIPERSRFRRGQTPQAFDYQLIRDAHLKAIEDGVVNATDDCQLVMRLGRKVYTVCGDEQNIKITYPIDLHIADKLFQLNSVRLPEHSEGVVVVPALKDKVFVVIGGTSGIGASLVASLKGGVSEKVYSLGRNTDLAMDICDPASINSTLEAILSCEGRIDYVVNCAGDLIRKPVANTELDEWRYLYDVNVTGCFNLAKSLTPIFQKQHSGSLMFVGSSSYTRGRAGYAAYSSSKAALVNFCQALSEELTDWGIQINVASPGRVATPLRKRNFGQEEPSILLSSEYVANRILQALAMDTTGSVFEIV